MSRTSVKEPGAIPALIGFVVGVWLAIPNEANLGALVVRAIMEISEPGTIAHQTSQNMLPMFVILGVVIAILTGCYIIQKFKEGELF